MSIATTLGIQVSAIPSFKEEISRVQESSFFFGYTIKIENFTKSRVQLLRRRWDIFDSLNELRVVFGEGVIGEQPILEPGECFSYSSSCDLHSELGFMEGSFIFLNTDTNQEFEVAIPRFQLQYYGRMN